MKPKERKEKIKKPQTLAHCVGNSRRGGCSFAYYAYRGNRFFLPFGQEKQFRICFGKNKYPYELSSGGDLSFGTVGSGLYVLDDSSFTVLDTSNASLVQTFNHGYSNPIVETAGSYSLLYDQGGTAYRLDTEKRMFIPINQIISFFAQARPNPAALFCAQLRILQKAMFRYIINL